MSRAPAPVLALLVSLISALAPARAADEAAAPEWKEVFRNEMITVYRREVPGSDVLAYKGEGTLSAPIGKILSVVADVSRRPEWMSHVKEDKVVRELSPAERIEYLHLSPPWPIKDRDVVFRETIEADRASRRITLRFRSIEDPALPPRPDRVRAMIYDSRLVLTPVDGGKRTEVEAETHADPKGSIPKWIVNIYQKRLPRESLEKLMRQVAQPGIPDHPLAAQVLGQGEAK